MNIFHNIVEENKDLLEEFGIKMGELGFYSSKTGVITFLSAGCTVILQMDAICLKIGWIVRLVKKR